MKTIRETFSQLALMYMRATGFPVPSNVAQALKDFDQRIAELESVHNDLVYLLEDDVPTPIGEKIEEAATLLYIATHGQPSSFPIPESQPDDRDTFDVSPASTVELPDYFKEALEKINGYVEAHQVFPFSDRLREVERDFFWARPSPEDDCHLLVGIYNDRQPDDSGCRCRVRVSFTKQNGRLIVQRISQPEFAGKEPALLREKTGYFIARHVIAEFLRELFQ